MYGTCLFCKRPLGSNEVVETFPVGRRLAFDVARGRLWVVCRKCRRWNLTPLEERWEAVETCERLFRATPLRASTDQIGLARHREGLELVRIGRPPRREFAAWRYGDLFRRRMWRYAVAVPAGGAVGALMQLSLPAVASIGLVAVGMAWSYRGSAAKTSIGGREASEVRVDPGAIVKFSPMDVRQIKMFPADATPGFTVEMTKRGRRAFFDGDDARRVASVVLPKLNDSGGTRRAVEAAVAEIEAQGHPERYLAHAVKEDRRSGGRDVSGYVRNMSKPTRLALEMALHEEQERRALEGELSMLEQAWREAEEIAAIADRLLLPAGTDAFFEKYGTDRRAGSRLRDA